MTEARATSQWQHLEMLFLGSTPRPSSMCCLSILRSKRGECHQPTQVSPFVINITSVYYKGKVMHIQGRKSFPEILIVPEEEIDPN